MMPTNPKISVVIPIYNVAEYLHRCIDSVLAQSIDGVEIILVDDGSTDASGDICDLYGERHENIKVVHKTNGGLSDARNVGTAQASGDWIFYLDSDDWLECNALEVLYHFAQEHDCQIVQGGFYYAYDSYLIYDNRFIEVDSAQVISREEAMRELIENNLIKNFAWGKLYRADIAKAHMFPKGKYFEDSYWQHLAIYGVARYGIVGMPLYYYMQRSASISGAFSARNIDLLRGQECRLAFIGEHFPQLRAYQERQFRRIAIQFAEVARHSGDQQLAKLYADYLAEKGISYSHICYTIKDIASRIFNRLFAKKLLRIENH